MSRSSSRHSFFSSLLAGLFVFILSSAANAQIFSPDLECEFWLPPAPEGDSGEVRTTSSPAGDDECGLIYRTPVPGSKSRSPTVLSTNPYPWGTTLTLGVSARPLHLEKATELTFVAWHSQDTGAVFELALRARAKGVHLIATMRDDLGSQRQDLGPVSHGAVWGLTAELVRSSSGVADGTARVWVDGKLVLNLRGLSLERQVPSDVRFGMLEVPTSSSGSLWLAPRGLEQNFSGR